MKDADNYNNGQRFSFFCFPITNTKPSKDFSLLDAYNYIVGDTAKAKTATLRLITDERQKRNFKAKNFDYCTFSGTFQYRNDKALIQHSGLLCLDFDHISNIEDVKRQLLQDEYFETKLMFRSPSGDGIKWIIEIDIANATHQNYFQAVANYLSKTYSLQVDKSGKDISRACFLPHDPDCVFNRINPFRKMFNPLQWLNCSVGSNPSNNVVLVTDFSNISQEIENLTTIIETSSIDIAPNYSDWRDLGFALADALGEGGRTYYHRLSRFYSNYSSDETDKQFSACLRSHGHGVTSKTLFHLAKQAGITVPRSQSPFPVPNTCPQIPISSISSESAPEEIEEVEEMEIMPTFSQEVIDNLPYMLSQIASGAKTPEEADLLILGAITVFSSCLPGVYGNYAGRVVYPNLFLFVAAQASAGKGILSLCRHLVQPIHENMKQRYLAEMEEYKKLQSEYLADKINNMPPQVPALKTLFIPANSSATSVYQILNDNEGKGLLFETEGDTLANTFKSDYGNFSDGLRKAFHHEMISYLRRKDREFVELPKPRLSVLLSGTPRQIHSLVPDTENGLFSRFIFYYMNIRLEWKNVFDDNQETLDDIFVKIGHEFYELYKLLSTQQMRFVFTPSQQKQFNDFFEQIQNEYSSLLGLDIIASIRRLGLMTFRIAMILTVLNIREYEDMSQILLCSDDDFFSTMTIVKTLLKHTSKVFRTLPIKENGANSNGQVVTKQVFYDSLPKQFNRKIYLEIASNLKILPKTAERYIYQFITLGKLKRMAHDSYEKNS